MREKSFTDKIFHQ